MLYMRGLPVDYDSWADNGATGWSWNDVMPYFLKSEDNKEIGTVSPKYHSTGGPLPVQKVRSVKKLAATVALSSLSCDRLAHKGVDLSSALAKPMTFTRVFTTLIL